MDRSILKNDSSLNAKSLKFLACLPGVSNQSTADDCHPAKQATIEKLFPTIQEAECGPDIFLSASIQHR